MRYSGHSRATKGADIKHVALGAALAYSSVFRSRRYPGVTPDNAFDFQSGRLP